MFWSNGLTLGFVFEDGESLGRDIGRKMREGTRELNEVGRQTWIDDDDDDRGCEVNEINGLFPSKKVGQRIMAIASWRSCWMMRGTKRGTMTWRSLTVFWFLREKTEGSEGLKWLFCRFGRFHFLFGLLCGVDWSAVDPTRLAGSGAHHSSRHQRSGRRPCKKCERQKVRTRDVSERLTKRVASISAFLDAEVSEVPLKDLAGSSGCNKDLRFMFPPKTLKVLGGWRLGLWFLVLPTKYLCGKWRHWSYVLVVGRKYGCIGRDTISPYLPLPQFLPVNFEECLWRGWSTSSALASLSAFQPFKRFHKGILLVFFFVIRLGATRIVTWSGMVRPRTSLTRAPTRLQLRHKQLRPRLRLKHRRRWIRQCRPYGGSSNRYCCLSDRPGAALFVRLAVASCSCWHQKQASLSSRFAFFRAFKQMRISSIQVLFLWPERQPTSICVSWLKKYGSRKTLDQKSSKNP